MNPSLDPLILRNMAIALLIGALVGIEREKKKRNEGGVGIAGLRTFIMFSLVGAVSALLAKTFQSPWILATGILAVSAAVLCGYVMQVQSTKSSFGLTTEMAGIAVCLLGALAMSGSPEMAVALGILTSATLALKRPLHGAVEKLGIDDILAGLKLLIATFIVLPLLPNRTVDPLGALNPYKLWLLVILISALSLVGYVASIWFGQERGTVLTGLTGGLVSSTAVTLALAKRSREPGGSDALDQALAIGILLSWLVMAGRIGLVVLMISPVLLLLLLPSLGAMALAILLPTLLAWFRGRHEKPGAVTGSSVPLENPFSLTAAVKFALFFALVLVFMKGSEKYLTGQGVYVIAALAGLTDVDAITLSMAEFAKSGGLLETAAISIVVATIANTSVKCGFAVFLGSRGLARRIGAITLLVIVSGAAPLFFLRP